ncbi:hypothetical protein RRG08_011060 [Elysia crispata]|uniref:Uncharacterized protein n=1 Tax=Elysia crispata TaxID=231223 RepID=A0AAE0Z8Y7_9GAST|nr:hypothetical protein RRG08_011060 [Elysia crispata]
MLLSHEPLVIHDDQCLAEWSSRPNRVLQWGDEDKIFIELLLKSTVYVEKRSVFPLYHILYFNFVPDTACRVEL